MKARIGVSLVIFAVAAVLPARELAGRQVLERVISGAPQCERCTLTMRHVATLGSPNDAVLLPAWLLIPPGRTRDGRFLVDGFTHSEVLVFTPSGSLARVVGRAGQGPNEFPRASKRYLAARGDSTYVLGSGRLFVLDSTLTEVRRMNVPLAPHYAVLGDGSIVVMREQYNSDSSLRVTVHGARGELTAAFAVREALARADACSSCKSISLAAADDRGGFWILHSNGFVLARWESDGRHVETIRIAGSPWHTQWLSEMRGGWASPDDRMPALEVRRRSDGLLLVSGRGSTSPKRTPLPAAQLPRSSAAAAIMAMEPDMDQAFDIVDPGRGVLATMRVRQRSFMLMQDGRHMARLIESPDGLTQLEIWEVVFTRG